jgi:hypothetical protein
MCLVSVSCKSIEVVASSEVQDVQKLRSVDTVVLRDTVYRHDSVIYRERTVLDTVYITKEVYRDRLHSTLNSQLSTLADTIHIVEYRDRVIEHPPERYVPKFYKWSTALFFILLLILGLGVFIKIKFKSK